MFFSSPKRKAEKALSKLGASVELIMQSARIVMTSRSLESKPHDWMDGSVVEVMVSRPGLDPYFIYYKNDDYYAAMAMGMVAIDEASKFENYRNEVSQALTAYLILHLREAQGVDILHPELSFSHNRIHTNVLAYVEKLRSWYPIRHSSSESDSATERKVRKVNQGVADITKFISIDSLSPA